MPVSRASCLATGMWRVSAGRVSRRSVRRRTSCYGPTFGVTRKAAANPGRPLLIVIVISCTLRLHVHVGRWFHQPLSAALQSLFPPYSLGTNRGSNLIYTNASTRSALPYLPYFTMNLWYPRTRTKPLINTLAERRRTPAAYPLRPFQHRGSGRRPRHTG